jgi:2-keto-3-deoxy-L-rhamnonate aldolase RhmA
MGGSVVGRVELNDNMVVNRMKRSLASGGYALGTIVNTIRHPGFMRILSEAGYDFAFIDTTHSALTFDILNDMCDMARACGIAPIVRPYDRSPGEAQRLLDVGAMGLLYPDIEDGEEVRKLRSFAKYAPEGVRGATGRGGPSTDYTRPGKLKQDEVRQHVNDNTLFAVQVESKHAVETLDEILDGNGVDVVEVGRTDLSTSYGVPSDIRNPIVLAALDKIVATCAKYNVTPGAGCYTPEDTEDMVARGFRWLTFSTDRQILQRAYREGHATLSALIAKRGGKLIS